jgi:hypothetical protein
MAKRDILEIPRDDVQVVALRLRTTPLDRYHVSIQLDGPNSDSWRFLSRADAERLRDALSSLLSATNQKEAA